MKICVKNKGENKINKQNELTSAQQTTSNTKKQKQTTF